MAVNVEGKSGGSMAEIALNGFYIVPILERQNGVGVPEIMHTAIPRADTLQHLLTVIIDRLRGEIAARRGCEHKSRFPLLLILPTFPKRPGLEPLFDLFPLPLLQELHNRWRRLDNANFAVLRFGKGKAPGAVWPLHKLFIDFERPSVEVNTIPRQAHCLSFPEAGKRDQPEQIPEQITVFIIPGCFEECGHLFIVERVNLFLLHARQRNPIGGIAFDVPNGDSSS